MAVVAEVFKIDHEHVLKSLQECEDKVRDPQGELLLDFTTVEKLDTSSLRELEKLAGIMERQKAKLVLRGVNVSLYKVLKLARLTDHLRFVL